MSVTDVTHSPETLTLTLTAQFDATVEAVWDMWADPRKLERWWGPPMYPATVVDFDLRPGGRMTYFMTGPDGEKFHGWWEVQEVAAPLALSFIDGFADESGSPSDEMPQAATRVSIAEAGHGRTDMRIVSTFPSVEAMEQLIAMGMLEGLTEAVNQIDALLNA
jgi:uncharacterized protein YndB with AHSA1/START domain